MAAEENKFIPKYVRRKISAEQISLTFTKSGNTYQFTPADVAKREARAFRAVQGVSPAKIADAIRAKLDQLDGKAENDGAIPYRPVRNIAVVCNTENEPEDMAAEYADTVFGEMSEKWKDAPLGEQDQYSEPAEELFSASIEDTVYGQDMRKLSRSDADNLVLIEDCAGAGPQYFYSDGRYSNGRQVWRKAFNPFLWYGTKS